MVAILAGLSFLPFEVYATTCGPRPPCGRIDSGSVLFTGMVAHVGDPEGSGDEATREVEVDVKEVFLGLPSGTKQVTVVSRGEWLQVGRTYLLDVHRDDGKPVYYPNICGYSGEVSDEDTAEFIEYLRQRAAGKIKTSLAVNVMDNFRPVSDELVTVTGPEGRLTGRTGSDGRASFSDMKPAKYHVSASRDLYNADPKASFNEDVDLVAGACASSQVGLKALSAVRGLVRDLRGNPAPNLELDLIGASENPDARDFSEPFFETKTDSEGRFTFESVSPGRYLLGSNTLGQNSSRLPAVYYPGQRMRNGAVPIEVKLGEHVEDLIFNLPDFGAPREIRVCVVDEMGAPVNGAVIDTTSLNRRDDFARLGEKLTTDGSGCVSAVGLTKAAYPVSATLRTGGDWRRWRSSDSVVIEPGEKPVRQILRLRPNP